MIIEILFNKKQILYYIYINIYKKIYKDTFTGVGWEEEGDHCVTNTPWSYFFYIYIYIALFSVAEPCFDTSSFSMDVVLASHQIQRSYLKLLV